MKLRLAVVSIAIALLGCGGKASSSSPGGNGGSGGSGGATPRSCEELSADYAQNLEKASICAPEMSSEQCTRKVSSGLVCGCPTFVNPANTEALAALDADRTASEAQGCGDEALCGPCLPDPIFAVCGMTPPNSSVPGLCMDNR